MVANTSWAPGSLEDILWALDRLTSLAPPDKLSTQAAADAVRVRIWSAQVHKVVVAAGADVSTIDVAPFPLSHRQLRNLEVEVLTALSHSPSHRGNAVLAKVHFPLGRLEDRLRKTAISSWLIAVALSLLVVVNVLDLLVFGNLPRLVVFGVNMVGIGVVFVVWAFHHFRYIAREWETLAHLLSSHLHGHHQA